MAVLYYDYEPGSTYSLEITPFEPAPEGPGNGYRMVIRDGEAVVFSQVAGWHEWQMEYFYLSTTAEAFREAGKLISAQITFESRFGQPHERPLSVEVGAPLAVIYLTGYRGETGNWIDIDLHLCPDWSQKPEGLLIPRSHAFLRVSVQKAERFGAELMREVDEIEETQRLRACDDAGICKGDGTG